MEQHFRPRYRIPQVEGYQADPDPADAIIDSLCDISAAMRRIAVQIIRLSGKKGGRPHERNPEGSCRRTAGMR